MISSRSPVEIVHLRLQIDKIVSVGEGLNRLKDAECVKISDLSYGSEDFQRCSSQVSKWLGNN